jgi:hypothetical protein
MNHLAAAQSRMTTFEAQRSNFEKVFELRRLYCIILWNKGNKNLSLAMYGMPEAW